MARRKKGLDLDETLSTEKPEIQEELLKDLVNEQDNQDKPVLNENNELNNLSNEPAEEPVIKIGDKVKIKKGTTMDCMGRRIHAGLQNYTYAVKNVRPDNVACIECLTHVFNVKLCDLEKIN